jgi:hypothetical protein
VSSEWEQLGDFEDPYEVKSQACCSSCK